MLSTLHSASLFSSLILLSIFNYAFAEDPFVFYDWKVSYITASPFGVKQQVIAVNGQFPGPILNVTTNWNVVINIKNDLDEPLLLTWNGIQHRKNSWQDGVLGTNCPIPAGGYGGIVINNRNVIPVPFGTPDGDITIFIGDWYTKSHKELRKDVENGIDLGVPDAILFNGLGPYRYDQALVPDVLAIIR
ncbi:Monocopper oxidase-like protein SKU5 [Vitis vinifera]|uniref:Monocopper oxidase-like protein SKU5 n=1 Tax=Vitis vinifera TaxID=29760 RepID=A0A438GMK2_VITVI|nr:Monocopper oxidase-like protein SKU5 [Vitis vinifera]